MRRLIVTTTILLLIGTAPLLARGGGMHGHGTGALSAPANPSVPPSLTPDARLTGSAPLPAPHPHTTMTDGTNVKPDPEDTKVDTIVKSICRGC
jgi:hypothetical protein